MQHRGLGVLLTMAVAIHVSGCSQETDGSDSAQRRAAEMAEGVAEREA